MKRYMALLIWKYELLTVAEYAFTTTLYGGYCDYPTTQVGKLWLREPRSPAPVSKWWLRNLNSRTDALHHSDITVSRSKV